MDIKLTRLNILETEALVVARCARKCASSTVLRRFRLLLVTVTTDSGNQKTDYSRSTDTRRKVNFE